MLCDQVKAIDPILRFSLVLNKVDLVEPKAQLLPLTDTLTKLCPRFEKVFMISAMENDGVKDVLVRGLSLLLILCS